MVTGEPVAVSWRVDERAGAIDADPPIQGVAGNACPRPGDVLAAGLLHSVQYAVAIARVKWNVSHGWGTADRAC